ncbi:MAG: (2Fe-2S)-binding protein [Bacteroidetes bacterium QS_8_64_10]|nr:MAG: (2Fe-2S)-binding protein [Bacteroidetes bacterium QS_8_64_10]
MPEITVDGETITFENEEEPKLLQFCLDQGVELPHFCYHPALSIPANCRQCLVEVGTPARDRESGELERDEDGNVKINWMPELQTSCSISASDGMVVKTHRTSEKVRRGQKDNLEFLLANHPLDCPICDQAGHCPLQIQSYKYGPEGSRFEFRKIHKPKRVRLGPNVTLDAERCINCTRCTRFTEEISGSDQLTIIERGVRNYPLTAPGEEFDDPYSMNTIDICPVGALTSSDSRFQARAWEMSRTPSITTTNAKGSNCFYHVRDNLIMDVTPRPNDAVNKFWLADEDRLDYKRFNNDRPEGPQVRRKGTLQSASWEEVHEAAADLVREAGEKVLFLGSARATVEDNYLLKRLADAVDADAPRFIPHTEPGHGDGWLRTDDRTPNRQGVERLGFRPVDEKMLRSQLDAGEYAAIYVLEDDPVASGLFEAEDLKDVPIALHHYNTTNETLPVANAALPAATVVETVGTYVSEDGHAQRVRPAKEIKGTSRILTQAMGAARQDTHGTPFDKWHNDQNRVDCRPGWVSLPAVAEALDRDLSHEGPKQVMGEVAGNVDAFDGATYDAMGLAGVRLEAESDRATAA